MIVIAVKVRYHNLQKDVLVLAFCIRAVLCFVMIAILFTSDYFANLHACFMFSVFIHVIIIQVIVALNCQVISDAIFSQT